MRSNARTLSASNRYAAWTGLPVRRLVLLAALLAWVAGCSSGLGRPVREQRAIVAADGVQHVEVVAHSFWFDPNRVVVKANVPVELHVKNGGPFIPHNLSCHARPAGIDIEEDLGLFWDGETARFTPRTPGEYPFFCDRDGHAKKGMTGTIVVR